MNKLHQIWKDTVIFYIGGMTYVAVEFLWRGGSHCSMFVVGGLDFLILGKLPQTLPMIARMLCGSVIITASELVSGLFLNEYMGLNVWSYSHLPLNFHGQICLLFSILWIPLSAAAVLENRFLRRKLFSEEFPGLVWA